MPIDGSADALPAAVRRRFVTALGEAFPALLAAVDQAARALASEAAESRLLAQRRGVAEALAARGAAWMERCNAALRAGLASGRFAATAVRSGSVPAPAAGHRSAARSSMPMSLVDNDTIEAEILASRLALAITEAAGADHAELRSRLAHLQHVDDLPPDDVLAPHGLARALVLAWVQAGLGPDHWQALTAPLHRAIIHAVTPLYGRANRLLIEQRVLPDIDLRRAIRRTRDGAGTSGGRGGAQTGSASFETASAGQDAPLALSRGLGAPSRHAAAPPPLGDQGLMILERLNRLIGRQIPEFASTTRAAPPASPSLTSALADAQIGLQRRFETAAAADDGQGAVAGQRPPAAVTPEVMLDELQRRNIELKRSAGTLNERAIIEIVALLFQNILTDERIPATVRVWFARLQMPVLRVAVGEPDFFATIDHPARRLIDRMGACVMGFDTHAQHAADIVEKEIKRVVQVVEAYPDTGRRVFHTVLTEFERFLEHYFRNENEASRRGISLAQQVEQRETLAVQYTIELRKMLDEMPVQEGVRDFLFQVWADVLAMSAVKSGQQSEETKLLKRAAADLIWSASAKATREERSDVIRRLPPLLKTLRDGMQQAQVGAAKQNDFIQRLNNSLAAAFTAKAAAIPNERLDELTARLEALEELLVDGSSEADVDESMVLDLSVHESAGLEVVAEGGSTPTAAMLAWARELQVGTWYTLDYRHATEGVQLVWQGMQKRLTLFVSPAGRGVLFQRQRLAAFLQAGLLVPVQTESLTVQATRSALSKLDRDPSRLLL